MQIIVVGDFFQLPPVPTKRSDCQCPTCGSQVKQYTKPGSKSSDGTMTSTSFFIFLFFIWGAGQFSRTSWLHRAPYAMWDMLYVVPGLIGC